MPENGNGASRQLPAFDPVPVRARRDGWTPERQRAFIAELHRGFCVDRAVRAVGMSRESAYRLRDRPGAGSFAAAWSAIMAARPVSPPDPNKVWYRAFHGVVKPIVRDGEVVATLHRPDNRAAMAHLRRLDRHRDREADAAEIPPEAFALVSELCDLPPDAALPPHLRTWLEEMAQGGSREPGPDAGQPKGHSGNFRAAGSSL